jgi:hypothetical protein
MKAGLLIAGCCVAILPQALQRPTPPDVPVTRRVALLPDVSTATPPLTHALAVVPSIGRKAKGPATRPITGAAVQVAATVEPIDPIVVPLPAAAPIAAIPTVAVTPLPRPATAIDLPKPALASLAVPVPSPPPAESNPLRVVDIAQLSDSEMPSLHVPQMLEPGAGNGNSSLSAKVAAMQVTPPPPVRIPDTERASLLAEAPTQMMVRIEGAALGKVDFQVAQDRTIAVNLGELLDLLAAHFDASEFARLRNSAAADAYVSFDKLRSIGLTARYDPVYDEVRITG